MQAAWAAVKTKDTYWKASFNRLKVRKGSKKALIAIGRKILVTTYTMLKNKTAYAELGADYVDAKMHSKRVAYHQRQLEHLGYGVALQVKAEHQAFVR